MISDDRRALDEDLDSIDDRLDRCGVSRSAVDLLPPRFKVDKSSAYIVKRCANSW